MYEDLEVCPSPYKQWKTMTGNVRVRVSKWDVPDETHVSGGFEQGNDRLGLQGNSSTEKSSSDSSARYIQGHDLSHSNAGGDITCSSICNPGSEPGTYLCGSVSEFVNFPKTSKSEIGKDDITWGGPTIESKTEFDGSIIKKLHKSNLSGVDSGDGDELWHNFNDNKANLMEGKTEKANFVCGPISSKVNSKDEFNNPQSTMRSAVDFGDREKLLTSDEEKVNLEERNDENRNSGWSPIPSKIESEDSNANNLQNIKLSYVDIGDRDKSWKTSSEKQLDHDHGNNEKNSGWGTSLGHIDNSSETLHGWHQAIRNSPPKISGGAYRCRGRSRSRSRSPTQGRRREGHWNDRNKSGPGFYRALCRDFMAGRCTRGSTCRYLHEDGGGNSLDEQNRRETDNQEKCDRGTLTAHDNKEYLVDSKEASGSSIERFSSAKRSRSDEDREEHNNYRYKKPSVQCINFSRGKCFRGPECKFAHHNTPNNGEREGGRAHDRAVTRLQSEHVSRHEARRSSNISCIFFPEGRCRNGDKCKFSHESPVQSVSANKLDNKWGSYGGNQNASTWNGPRWGETTINAQNNASGWGGDNIHAVSSTPYASNSAATPLQPQGHDATFSALPSESQIIFPDEGQHVSSETSRQHNGYDTSYAQNSEGVLVKQPAVVKKEYISTENAIMATSNSLQNVRPGIGPFPVHGSDLLGQSQVIAQVSTTNPINQSDLSGLLNVPKAQSQYIGLQAPPSVANLNNNNQYPSFGGQDPSVYSQLSTTEGQYPPMQPVGNVRGSGTSDQTQQVTTQTVYAVQSGQGNYLPDSNKGGIASSDGTISNVMNTVTTEQMAQITNISASLAQIFGTGQQLPQMYAAHNPNAPGVPLMPQFSQSLSVIPIPGAAPAHQPHVHLLSQQHQNSIPSHIMPPYTGVTVVSSQIPADTVEQTLSESAVSTRMPVPNIPTIGYDVGDHSKNTNSEWTMNEIKTVETGEQNGSTKTNDITSNQGKKEQLCGPPEGSGADPDIDKVDGKDMDKDAKGIRLFKYALVEHVKEVLKPIWKEGNMSKEVHKTIVKKVVDKVTGALQFNIPQTQDRIDLYMEHSKAKLGKLVQAYVEKYSRV